MRLMISSKKLIKAVIKLHRLLGFIFCLLFVIWCLSGFVMMYKGFPSISDEDKIKLNNSIDVGSIAYPKNIEEFIDLDSISSIKIQAINNKTVFTIKTKNEAVYNLSQNSNSEKITYSYEDATSIIQSYYSNSTIIKEIELINELDQWIPRTLYMKHMPIYRAIINNDEKTVWYISSKTGETLQKLNYSDKVWAWLGAIPHWIYFKDLRINTPLWRFVVILLSFLGVLLSIAGIILGINRFRIARKRKLRLTPYKKKWFKWHHYLGFTFGLFTFTWILSGLFSMNPLQWSPEDSITQNQQQIWEGKSTLKNGFNEKNFNSLMKHLKGNDSIVHIDFKCFENNLYAIENYKSGRRTSYLLNQNLRRDNSMKLAIYTSKIQEIFPNDNIVSSQMMNEYDDYYYSRKNKLPLPIYKYELGNDQQTAIYVDPISHQVLKKIGQKNRVERWVYNGLHSLDFTVLRNKRPLWDIVVIVLLLGVTLLSFTGTILTYKKLFRKK